VRILVADDHDLLRDTLDLWFQRESIAVTHARDLGEALEIVLRDKPFDLVLLDYGMPGMDGLEGLRRMRATDRAPRVALMSGTASRDVAEEALAMGAAGFLPKTMPARSLVNAVRFMAMGEQFAPIDFMTAPTPVAARHPLEDVLTPREVQVLRGLCEGKANKEIARDLDIGEPTVKLHVKTLYRKIGAGNRTQAAMIAKDQGLC
jgi:two-component system, NarL family, nitrate/nitrite response regulator NarL